jgi:hypothetical protein
MPDPSPVNSQITDAVTQTNVKVIGESPAEAMGDLYQQEGSGDAQNTPPEEGE